MAYGAAATVQSPDAPQLAAATAELPVLSVTFEGKSVPGIAYALREGSAQLLDVDTLARLGVRAAFEYARAAGRRRVTMSDKSNALRFGHDLWQRTFWSVAPEFPGIEANHLYVDALTMAMVKDPSQFEVIVTNNMFGDIVTDLGAQLQGGLGMAASGNLHPGRTSMFEPVHGSAPKYAGRDRANPFAAILTAAMMLEHTGAEAAARRIERAVVSCLAAGECSADVGGTLGTSAVGDAVAHRVQS